MNEQYEPNLIETAIQQDWEETNLYSTTEDFNKEKAFILSMFPYPSGDIHMGHVRNYTLGDVIARVARMQGKNILHPPGWDAFGLPAENAAIKHKTHPAKWTYQNIAEMRKQFKRLGFSYDWNRELLTCDPKYYRWEQWLFVRLFKKGLVYKKLSLVNWDPVDQTVLANEQVVDGKGWRSGAPIERREIAQWFLKITDYAQELLDDLDTLDQWPEQVRTMQRHWIGRSEGVQITFHVKDSEHILNVFTTRADTLYGATYLSIAPQHPLALLAATHRPELKPFLEECAHIQVAEAALATLEKRGQYSGFMAIHPLTGEHLPIWIANFVLMDYGSGAVMSVPAHDQRDFEFAKKYNIPLKIVICNDKDESKCEPDDLTCALTEKGRLINSGPYDGLNSQEAIEKITADLEKKQQATRQIHFRLRDWGVSRQRYWGAPIPIIFCPDCDAVPVPEDQLPVVLPEDIEFTGPHSPLTTEPSFFETNCPQCGKKARRETDTFDTFMESSWYYARFACHDQHQAMLDDRANYWTPVDHYVGGIEHAVMHLLYARFLHRVMRDEGLLHSNEPFKHLLTQGMVLKDGSKMSKSKGNVVSPQIMIDRFGADTVRVFILFAAPPDQALEWSDSGIEGTHRFLKRLWSFAYTHSWLRDINIVNQSFLPLELDMAHLEPHYVDARRELHQTVAQMLNDFERFQFNTVVSGCMKILNLLGRLEETHQDAHHFIVHEGFSFLLRLLSPIAPHITDHLWRELNYGECMLKAPWPKVDHEALQTNSLTLMIQINGKLRSELRIAADASEETIQAAALALPAVQSFLSGKSCKKIIVVPRRLVNVVIG